LVHTFQDGSFLVISPVLGVGVDEIADAAKGVVGVDDMFIIITLPDRRARRVPQGVHAFGGDGFKLANGGTGVWPAWVRFFRGCAKRVKFTIRAA
jgi:hypothetical protein